MIIKKITLERFRNRRENTYFPAPDTTIVCGDNGRGKTNLLEGVFLLSGLKSWRTSHKSELVMWGEEAASVKAEITSRNREFQLRLDIEASGRTAAFINGVKVTLKNPLSDVFRAVLFSPEDLLLVKGGPSARRNLMDSTIFQMRPRYAQLWSKYLKIIKEKSRLLKEASVSSSSLLGEYNILLAQTGAKVLSYRAAFCRQMDISCRKIHEAISDGEESLELKYKTVSTVLDLDAGEGQIEQWLHQHLLSHREAEARSGMCLSGLHRDDIEIYINGRPAKTFASQGQARSCALALRFGQRGLLFDDLGEHPVLLLDDVLSELDEKRRAFVYGHSLGGQSIITCCQPEKGFEKAMVIDI